MGLTPGLTRHGRMSNSPDSMSSILTEYASIFFKATSYAAYLKKKIYIKEMYKSTLYTANLNLF